MPVEQRLDFAGGNVLAASSVDHGGAVIDPFLAAHRTGRVCRGVGLDPLYVYVVVHRFKVATGLAATLVKTGQAFQALRPRREYEGA